MNRTKSLYEQARNLNLADVLKNLGWEREPHKVGLTQTWRLCGRKIAISKNYAWTFLGEEVSGGGAIDLVSAIRGISARESVNYLMGMTYQNPSPITNKKPDLKIVESAIPDNTQETWEHVKKWLCGVRKIDEKLIDDLHGQGLIQSDKNRNAVFIGSAGGTVGCELRGTGSTRFAGRRGGNGLFELEPIDKNAPCAIVESAIDALSLRELGHQGRIVSSGGTFNKTALEYLLQTNEKIIAAFDSDEAGDAYFKKLSENIPSAKRIIPHFDLKDWNDVLIVKKM